MENPSLLRQLPGVDKLLGTDEFKTLAHRHGRPLVVHAIRRSLEMARAALAAGAQSIPDINSKALRIIDAIVNPSLKPVINATGILLHTNLGRAPLGAAILADLTPIILGYSNVEFDLDAAARGHRIDHIRELMIQLTGAEDVVAVNNNAAGIILALSTFAKGKEVIISRGELIEIGGAFRIPEIMESSDAIMVEVGTTNRTRAADYESAITPNTALIFKAHKSNYTISGFTEEVSVRELATLAHAHNLPFVYDIGSGLLRKPPGLPQFQNEPDVRQSISDGADLVTFSTDKLMGGPQAGIVAGTAKLVSVLAKAPLMRALRVGKLTLAALSSSCRQYLSDEDLTKKNPLFSMLQRSPTVLKEMADRFCAQLSAHGIESSVVASQGQCGGGTLPDCTLPSMAVSLIPPSNTVKDREVFAETIFHRLLRRDCPILGILREGHLFFDMLTLTYEDIATVTEAIVKSIETERPA